MADERTRLVLIEARDWIEAGWCQKAWGHDDKGEIVTCDELAGATEICLSAAIAMAAGEHPPAEGYYAAAAEVANLIDAHDMICTFVLIGWNDAPERTQGQVVALLSRAISRVEKRIEQAKEKGTSSTDVIPVC